MHEKQHDERRKWHRNHLIEQVTFFNHDGKKLSCRKVMENRVDNMLKLVKIIQKNGFPLYGNLRTGKTVAAYALRI